MSSRSPVPASLTGATPSQEVTTTASSRASPFRRTYVACVSCRTRKVKCIISDRPPCAKCSREHRECVFDNQKTKKKQRAPPVWSTSNASEEVPATSTYDQTGGTINQTNSSNTRSAPRYNRAPLAPSFRPGSTAQIACQSTSVDQDVPVGSHVTFNSRTKVPPYVREQQITLPALQVVSAETQRRRRHSTILSDQVVRTVVSKPTDALNLLFDAAQAVTEIHDDLQRQPEPRGVESIVPPIASSARTTNVARSRTTNSNMNDLNEFAILPTPETVLPITPAVSNLSFPLDEVLDVWGRCRFVIQGWFTAQEAVTLVDLFFENLADASPILPNSYRYHYNHHSLVSEEPMLCTTILMISSRYHTLPGIGGVSRGYHIHQRLWRHCEHLIQRVMLGQEKYSTAKTRTLGTIESFLLISEWTPRAILFPPETDGWDAQLLSTDIDVRHRAVVNDQSAPARWQEDVFLPSKRSDSMSWMLVGAATSLAYELGVFIDTGSDEAQDSQKIIHHARIRRLLFVYVNQIAARLGCASILPQSITQLVSRPPPGVTSGTENSWNKFMDHWVDITKLMKTSLELLFPSAKTTRQLILDGRYAALLQHFGPSLQICHEKILAATDLPKALEDVLHFEYHYVKAYINSLAIQAVVDRAIERGIDRLVGDQDNPFFGHVESHDYACINEVKDSSLQILQRGIAIAQAGSMRYTPMRVILRIASASLFLLKSISLGGHNNDIQTSLKILDDSNAALRANPVDDMDLASRYATLLERHTMRFRKNFTSARQPDYALDVRDGLGAPDLTTNTSMNAEYDLTGSYDNTALDVYGWSIQPFDPSLAPFSVDGNQMFFGFDNSSLDFLWNAPNWE